MDTPRGLPKSHDAVAAEVHRIHESARDSAQGQFEQMKVWRMANLFFGLPAAVLAAVSGATGLAADQVTHAPAVLALIAAAFGAGLTTLNPSRRVTQAQTAAGAYLELQTAARQLYTIDLPHLSYEDARDRLQELTVRRDEINKTADPPNRYAYWLSRRNLKRGGQTYEIDQHSSKASS